MRTLGHCQKHDLTIYAGCKCGWHRKRPARAECRAMAALTIEHLQRSGWFACEDCGHSRDLGVSIYRDGMGYPTQLEGWRLWDRGFIRPVSYHGY